MVNKGDKHDINLEKKPAPSFHNMKIINSVQLSQYFPYKSNSKVRHHEYTDKSGKIGNKS